MYVKRFVRSWWPVPLFFAGFVFGIALIVSGCAGLDVGDVKDDIRLLCADPLTNIGERICSEYVRSE